MNTTHGTYRVSDVRELTALSAALKKAPQVLRQAINRWQPEFGAYMLYSFWLEVGTVRTKLPPRPHIVPAVKNTATEVSKEFSAYLLGFMRRMFTTGGAGGEAEAVRESWLRVLNGPMRIEAVNLARAQGVYEYGFHMRSISGFVKPRSPQKIVSEYKKAMRQRKAMSHGRS